MQFAAIYDIILTLSKNIRIFYYCLCRAVRSFAVRYGGNIMETLQTVFGIILLIAAVFLVVAVLMQSGKAHNLSGAIAGGAETFFGKTKGKTMDKMLSKLTTIVSICFVVLVIIVYVIQPDTVTNTDKYFDANVDLSGDAAVEDVADAADDAALEAVENAEVDGEEVVAE